MILGDGDVSTLAALAMTVEGGRGEGTRVTPRVTLLHEMRGRADDAVRWEHAERMAGAYKSVRVVELPVPGAVRSERESGEGPASPLHVPRLLLAAVAYGRSLGVERVVWSCAVGEVPRQVAQVTEVLMLCDHLVTVDAEASEAVDGRRSPRLEAPLLGLTPGQVVELGEQLEVDWSLAWSCEGAGPGACHGCRGCRERARAFEVAGVSEHAA